MLERRENIIVEKTERFGDRIVNMHQYLMKKKLPIREMLTQVLRSGMSIGANTAESQYAQSTADFLTKLTIALKEANETRFWINRIYTGGYLSEQEYTSILSDNEEIIKILTSITATVKRKQRE